MTLATRNGSAAPSSDRKATSKRRNGKALPASAALADDVAIMDRAAAIACADDVAAPVAAPRPPYVPIQAAPVADVAALDSAMGLDSDVAPVVAAAHPLTNDATFGPLAVLRAIPAAHRAAIVVGRADVATVVGAQYNLTPSDVQSVRDGYGTVYLDPEIAAIVAAAVPESTATGGRMAGAPRPAGSGAAESYPGALPSVGELLNNPSNVADAPVPAADPGNPLTSGHADDVAVPIVAPTDGAALWTRFTSLSPEDMTALVGNDSARADAIANRVGLSADDVRRIRCAVSDARIQAAPPVVAPPASASDYVDISATLPIKLSPGEGEAVVSLATERIIERSRVDNLSAVRSFILDGDDCQRAVDSMKTYLNPDAWGKQRRNILERVASRFEAVRYIRFDFDRALMAYHLYVNLSPAAADHILSDESPVSPAHLYRIAHVVMDRDKDSDVWTMKGGPSGAAAVSALIMKIGKGAPEEFRVKNIQDRAREILVAAALEAEKLAPMSSQEARQVSADAAVARSKAITKAFDALDKSIRSLAMRDEEVCAMLALRKLTPDPLPKSADEARAFAESLVQRNDPTVIHAILGRLLSYTASAASKPAGPAGPSLNDSGKVNSDPLKIAS